MSGGGCFRRCFGCGSDSGKSAEEELKEEIVARVTERLADYIRNDLLVNKMQTYEKTKRELECYVKDKIDRELNRRLSRLPAGQQVPRVDTSGDEDMYSDSDGQRIYNELIQISLDNTAQETGDTDQMDVPANVPLLSPPHSPGQDSPKEKTDACKRPLVTVENQVKSSSDDAVQKRLGVVGAKKRSP